MDIRLFAVAAACLVCLLSQPAFAQSSAGIWIAGSGLVSVEPVEDKLGGVYQSAQIGRFATGIGVEASAIVRAFTIAAEVTTAKDELTLAGRLISGGGEDQGRSRLVTQRQTFLTVLAGYATKGPNTRLLLLGGMSKVFNQSSLDGIDDATFTVPWSFTAGMDLTFRDSARVGFVTNARYAFLRVPYDGYQTADDQVLKVGVGVRFRLNN